MSAIRKQIALVIGFGLLGALFFEIVMDHRPVYELQRGGFGLVPVIYTPLALASIALFQVWSTRWTFWLYVALMAVGVAVGVIGIALHLAIHASSFDQLLTAGFWAGEPPTLAPLSFSLGGLLGLISAVGGTSQIQNLEARSIEARFFYLLSLASTIVGSALVIITVMAAPGRLLMGYGLVAVLLAVAFTLAGAFWDWTNALADHVFGSGIRNLQDKSSHPGQ